MYDFEGVTRGCFTITQSNTTQDPEITEAKRCRGVWINAAGNLKVTFMNGETGTFAVAANTLFAGEIKFVWSTGTTATLGPGVR